MQLCDEFNLVYFLPIVDGDYSDWSVWTSCSKSCGTGSQTRNRSCSDPKPQNGGANCDRLGPINETKACNTQKCYEGKGTIFC